MITQLIFSQRVFQQKSLLINWLLRLSWSFLLSKQVAFRWESVEHKGPPYLLLVHRCEHTLTTLKPSDVYINLKRRHPKQGNIGHLSISASASVSAAVSLCVWFRGALTYLLLAPFSPKSTVCMNLETKDHLARSWTFSKFNCTIINSWWVNQL